MSKDQPRLGRGLSSLIPTISREYVAGPSRELPAAPVPGFDARVIPIESIRPNPRQPRKTFDEGSLIRMAESIKKNGTLQPVVVRIVGDHYELVTGERRLRAAKMAGAGSLPAIVRRVGDGEMLELALIENLHREDLNPVERAMGYLEIKNRFNLSNDDLADRLGEERATVSNYLRILDLTDDILALVADGRLGMGQARSLLGIGEATVRSRLAQRIALEGWSARKVEEAVRSVLAGRVERAATAPTRPAIRDLEARLSGTVGTRVRVQEGRKRNTGRIVVEYYSLDDFDRITNLLGLRSGED